MKILNLYAGIGGNRKLWGDGHEITAIENNSDIAKIYSDFFPNDKIIITDAHQYLLEHFKEFDFIWSSPPCPSHSKINFSKIRKIEYPDMKLYEEIILLKTWYNGKFIVENVIPYYNTLIKPIIELDRHCFWANFRIGKYKLEKTGVIRRHQIPDYEKIYNYDLSKYKISDKRQILRNCVNPELGLHILNRALEIKEADKYSQLQLY